MDQLESELQTKKMQVLAMMENHDEVQKELGELRERAQQLDETSAKAASMEEFLMGLQEERNALAVKLKTAEAQITSLAAMLGKVSISCSFVSQEKAHAHLFLSEAQNAGNAEEIQKALDAAKTEHTRELEALRVQIQRRDDELARVQGAMSTLRRETLLLLLAVRVLSLLLLLVLVVMVVWLELPLPERAGRL